jgi:hypothetical protein
MPNYDTLPDPIDADYTLWTPNTVVELHNVPWDPDYKDIIDWDSQAAKVRYFDQRAISARTRIEAMSYARISEPIRLEIPFATAYRYNYVRIINGPQVPVGNPAQEFYYFITSISQPNPGVTTITVQLDVWTSFSHNVNFGKCFVERGHIGIANVNNFSTFGRDFLTTPEGLDVGNEYQVVHHVNHDVMHKSDREHSDSNLQVMVASTVDFESSGGTISEPKLSTAKGDNVQGIPSGAQYYVFPNIDGFRQFMTDMKDKPWLTQGIISISVVPDVFRYGGRTTTVTIEGTKIGVARIDMPNGGGLMFNFMENWRDSPKLLNMIPLKYRRLRKFFTFPYMVLELTNFAGSPVILKPELWNDPHAWMSEKAAFAAPNQRIVHHPVKYNAGRGSTIVDRTYNSVFDDNGEYLNAMVATTNLPTLAIVNNGFLAFMGSNAHGINQQYEQANWSQERALQSSRVSYDQANNSIGTGADVSRTGRNLAIDQNAQANEYAWQTTGLGAIGNVAGGIVGGPAGIAGGLSSAAMSAVGNLAAQGNRNASTGLNNRAAVDVQRASQSNQQYLADTNNALAQWSARGDYSQAVASINARVQDARLTQPSVSGQAGGDAFNLIHGGMILSLRFKMMSYNAICAIGDYWLRYGYAVNRYVTLSKISVMSKFTYWKLSELYLINTYLPEFIKHAIRGIFEKGVTVWQDPADIGVIDFADNDPVDGIVISVDELPVYVPDEPEELTPNLDEEDDMYLISIVEPSETNYFGVGRGFLNDFRTSNSGTFVPKTLVGKDFLEITKSSFVQALRMNGIPEKYQDATVFRTENPSGIWSQETENAEQATALQQSVDDNAVTLAAILQKLDNPDTPAGD